MKKIILLMLMMWQSSVFSYELNYSRTYNKVIADNNELSFNLKADGELTLTIPSFKPSPPYVIKDQISDKTIGFDLLIEDILKKKINSLNRKMALINSDKSLPRFYSSEVDKLTLSISENGAELKRFELYNLEELRYHYSKLGEWQSLVDLIDQIQTVIAEGQSRHKAGGQQ